LKNKIAQNQDDPETDIRQFQTEIETWKELLNSRVEENVLLKNKISEILKNNYEQNLLEVIEDFQTQFIKEDELINSLKRNINELDNLMFRKLYEDGKIEKSFGMKMVKLGKDILNSTARFRILHSSFVDFQHTISRKREN
jgi:hypothetical protein